MRHPKAIEKIARTLRRFPLVYFPKEEEADIVRKLLNENPEIRRMTPSKFARWFIMNKYSTLPGSGGMR